MEPQVNTLSGALIEGLQVTVVGLAIVFAVLIILMLVLMALKTVFYKGKEKTAEVEKMPSVAVQNSETSATSVKTEELPEEELIAVLTAAVAASLNTSTYHLQIKSYRRIGNHAPAWNRAGLEETIHSHF